MASRPVYPISLLLDDKPCLVVGARHVALGKIQDLLKAGASVTVIALDAIEEVRALPITLHIRGFQPGDTTGFSVVIAATGDLTVDAAVFADGASSGALVNSVDNSDSCDFFLPALFHRGQLSVAISTGGASPAIASWVRERLDDVLDERFSDIVDLVAAARTTVRDRGLSSEGMPWADLINQMVAAVDSGSGVAHCRALCDLWLESELTTPAADERDLDE